MVQFPTQEEVETKTTGEIVEPEVKTRKTLADIQAEIDKAQAMTEKVTKGVQTLTADQLKETGDLTVPEPVVEQKDLTTANGFLERQKVAADEETKRIETERKARETAAKEQEATRKKTLAEKFGLTKEEKIEEEQEELGVDPTAYLTERKADIAELEGMWTSYNNKVAERDAAVAANEGRVGVSLDYQTAEGRRITNKYNVEINRIASGINSKSAIMASKKGLMNEARSFVKEAVDDYTYEKRLAYERFDAFEEENKEALEDIGDKYEAALAESKAWSYEIWKADEAEQTEVGKMMIDPAYATANIKIGDTIEEAREKIVAAGVIVAPKVPTTKMVGKVLYQWDPATKTWGKAIGIDPTIDTITYTPTQLGKLRAFGIDVADTEAADTLLFKGEEELKKLLQNREKEGQVGWLGGTADVFSNVWNSTKSFFGF